MRKLVLNISVMLMAGAVSAQTQMAAPAAQKKPATTATAASTKPASMAKTPVAVAAKPATPAVKSKTPAAASTAKKNDAKAKTAAPAAAKMTVKPEAKPKPAKKMPTGDMTEKSVVKGGRRDPFISPIKQASEKAICTTGGSQCLVIDQVNLLGVVKTQKGMIAMVENTSKKQYNLHESDVVMNGKVVRITRDSVVFRETITDNLGRSSTREVVKKVTVPVV